MAVDYTYKEFNRDRNPLLPLAATEYVMMRRDLNNFMNDMLRKLYKDKDILGVELQMKRSRIFLFGLVSIAAAAGAILFEHPGWIASSAILGVIMFVAVLAVPITHLQDKAVEKRDRKRKIDSIKSYYLFHYSLMRNSSTYNEYLSDLPVADLNIFQSYLQKYK